MIELRRFDQRQGTFANLRAACVSFRELRTLDRLTAASIMSGWTSRTASNSSTAALKSPCPVIARPRLIKLGMMLGLGIVDRLDVKDHRFVEHLHLLEMHGQIVQQFPVAGFSMTAEARSWMPSLSSPCRARHVPRSASRSESSGRPTSASSTRERFLQGPHASTVSLRVASNPPVLRHRPEFSKLLQQTSFSSFRPLADVGGIARRPSVRPIRSAYAIFMQKVQLPLLRTTRSAADIGCHQEALG